MTIRTLATWLATRERKRPVTTVVLHASAGASALSSISWLRQISLSYHYVIERDGTIYKCAPASRVAFHAGRSLGPDGTDVNSYSVGICFANRNDGKEPITPEQRAAASFLCVELQKQFKDLIWVTRHRDVSPGRKTDPNTFAKVVTFGGLRFWP
jgi:N-acetylmuramoyl-L-alanine amidase